MGSWDSILDVTSCEIEMVPMVHRILGDRVFGFDDLNVDSSISIRGVLSISWGQLHLVYRIDTWELKTHLKKHL